MQIIKQKWGFNRKKNFLAPSKQDLDLTKAYSVNNWFSNNQPDIVINANWKVRSILANSKNPVQFLLYNMKI